MCWGSSGLEIAPVSGRPSGPGLFDCSVGRSRQGLDALFSAASHFRLENTRFYKTVFE